MQLTNLDKVLWPEVGFSKGQMISYYRAIAPVLLPHLRDRPVTLKRYPDGVDGIYWFQNNCPGPPRWMRTQRVAAASGASRFFDYCTVDDLASLLWVANTGAVELHPLLARAGVDDADVLVFDLDPAAPAGLIECCDIALSLRDLLTRLGLEPLVKTSGATGLHVYARLATPASFAETKREARRIAAELAKATPEKVTATKSRTERGGKVLIDWSQNAALRSMVAPYSLRAMPVPSVSTPVAWDEVDASRAAGDWRALLFGPREVLERVEARGDLFAAAA